jgi:DNA-directed RNA polymerase beta' subunit
MNAHIPQSYEAAIELEEIAAVPRQIISPRHAKPVIGIVQDTLVGSYLLTQNRIKFNKREFMNLMMWNEKFNGQMPAPRAEGNAWSGQQVLSTLLPPVNMEMGNTQYDDDPSEENKVIIREGDLVQGVVDKDIYSKASRGIVHVAYNDYGPKEAVRLIDSLQMTVEHFLILNGFSVGISDLIADETTKNQMDDVIQECKKKIADIILQVHMDLFDNKTGKTNKEEFETRIFAVLNDATKNAGGIGQKSLSKENRMTAMVRSGSKGGPLNIAQMIALVGQQNVEGKRIPYGFDNRTLPHYKKYDDGAEARGFIESSFIKGLTPQEFYFHAMSGREGLIDTAVKSVTADTPIIVLENGKPKYTAIGDWIDAQIDGAAPEKVEHYDEANMELLNLEHEIYIPTCDMDGKTSWGKMTAVTRHDPGDILYKIVTQSGRNVIVTAGKSLLIWNEETNKLEQRYTTSVNEGNHMPVNMNICNAPTPTTHIDMADYFPKSEWVYGTDFHKAKTEIEKAMVGRKLIPNGWWAENNGKLFTLPYANKGRFQRVNSGRSNVEAIKPGFVYPFHIRGSDVQLPDKFELNERNGIFIGLFLADGNVDISSGYVQITKNNEMVRNFAKSWFDDMHIKYKERSREINLKTVNGKESKGTSSDVRAFSRPLAEFLDALIGHGSENKHIPDAAYTAPLEFVRGLLNGYFSGDGYIGDNSISASSTSKKLTEGITFLCNRIGVFGYYYHRQQKSNNLGSENILLTHDVIIRSKWVGAFASQIKMLNDEKQEKLARITHSKEHINYKSHNDIVLDKIVQIVEVTPENYPKMYDVTVPSTFNFMIANGSYLADTADSGYTQRQLVKAMEDLVTHHDGSVRDANMNIVQFHYGEDGINATKIENISIDLHKMSEADVRNEFAAMAPPEYIEQVLEDRKMLIEKMGRNAVPKDIFSSVNITRILQNIRIRFRLQKGAETDLTANYVIDGIKKIIGKTQKYHKLWAAFLRFHCAPHKLIGAGFTKVAFDTFAEMVIIQNWKSWAQPGEQVGILAAQSIGEPTTQLTLNSVDYDTEIIIAKNGRIWTPQIGEFIDKYYNDCENKSQIQYLENDQVYIELDDGNDWKALSCDEDGKMMWTKLEAITRHPVINEDGSDTILEVELESGRKVKATKAKSFLTLRDNKIVDANGSDLKIGDCLPIKNSFAIEQLGFIHALNLREYLPATEWLYGTDAQTALKIMKEENEKGNRKWFTANNGSKFTVPYSRSDGFRDAFVNGRNTNEIKEGCVYPKRTRPDISHIPESIPLDAEFGFFAGVYLAEGMSNSTQINITNNDVYYLTKVSKLMDQWNVGHHTVCEQRFCETTGIKGTSTSLVIHSTLLATVMKTMFGRVSYEKSIPDWVFQAPDDFIKGLIDGYISGDGTVDKQSLSIRATSCSHQLLRKLRCLLTRYGIFGTISSKMPEQKNFKSVSMHYILSLRVDYSVIFANIFTLTSKKKQEKIDEYMKKPQKGVPLVSLNDVIMDRIISIKEIKPMTKYVFDLTVEKTRNFVSLDDINVKDTFHLAGIASKSNVTRGVPRLKELLKVTRNPKATSLNIYLKKEFRDSKEKARQVVQDLELTLLRDITKSFAIYYDPKEKSIIKEDHEILEIFKLFEMSKLTEIESPSDISKWLIRLEFDRNKMFDKNITINDVVYVLQTSYPEIQMSYSDFNSQKLILRIRIPNEMGDSLEDIKALENKILNGVILRGMPGIKAAIFNKNDKVMELIDGKYEKINQYVLETDGSNFVEVMNHPAVDGTKLYSTHVHDIYNILGIEATRVVLYNEIYGLFAEAGINYRHLGLLCDVMTHAGNLMSIDRYGINKMNIGPLAKASFEETGRILLKASLFGELDPVTGVSANIMTGQTIRSGTSFTQILLDEAALMRVMKGLPPAQQIDEEEIDLSEIDKLMIGEIDDPCARTEFQMNMAMPPEIIYEEEPDVEMVIVDA